MDRLVRRTLQPDGPEVAVSLFLAERNHRVDARRAARRNPRGQQPDEPEQERDGRTGRRIVRRHLGKQRPDESPREQRRGEPDDEASGYEPSATGEDIARHVGAARTQSHAHADLAPPPAGRIRDDAIDPDRRQDQPEYRERTRY